MLRVYFLPVEVLDDTEQVAGTDLIHNALLDCTDQADVRKLIMDTTDDEHASLAQLFYDWRLPDADESALFYDKVIPYQPTPDEVRAAEILATSPDAITMPEMWELLRIYGRRLGYRF